MSWGVRWGLPADYRQVAREFNEGESRMIRFVTTALFAIAAVVGLAAAPGPSAWAAAPASQDSLKRMIEKGRTDTEAWLKSDSSSYLAAVRRLDFDERTTLTVGRAAGNDLRLDDSTLATCHLRVTVVGDSFQVDAVDPGA